MGKHGLYEVHVGGRGYANRVYMCKAYSRARKLAWFYKSQGFHVDIVKKGQA